MSRRWSNDSGFSLLEVLAALAILASGLAIILPVIGQSTRAAARHDEQLNARMFATSLLDEQLSSRVLTPGRVQGRHGDYRWTLVIAPADETLVPQAEAGRWQLFRVAALIDWGRGRRLEVETLHLGKGR
jgi:general secretion pathway protein I